MPRNVTDDFVDAIRYAAEMDTTTLLCGLQSNTIVYDDEFDESLTGSWGSRPLSMDFSNDCADRLISDIQAANSYIQTTRKTDIGAIVCEVCGEPLPYTPYHICNRCRLAAQKFKDCLTEEELGRV